jgi:hypothetical protein
MADSSRATLAAALLIFPLTICAGEPVTGEPEMETVLVTGEQRGPGLWKVSRDGHVMWVLGSIGVVPDSIAWRTKEVEARISESREVLFPGWPRVSVDIGMFEALSLAPAAFRAAKNPGGMRLNDVLDADSYAAWRQLRRKYLDDDEDVEKYRPFFAEEKLNNAIGKRMMKGLRMKPVHQVIQKAAKKHKVPIHTLPDVVHKIEIEKPRAILKAARQHDLAEGACVGRNLQRLAKADAAGRLTYDVATTNAWATGDIQALRSKAADAGTEPRLREDCMTVALDAALENSEVEKPAEMRRGLDLVKRQAELYEQASQQAEKNWLDAAEAALARNSSTFAVLPINLVLEQSGWLAKLEQRGYVVEHQE